MLLAVVLPVYGKEKAPQANSHQEGPSNTRPKEASGAQAPPLPRVNVVNQKTAYQEGNAAKNNSKNYLSRLFSPENLPSVGLFIAGVLGIIVAIATLKILRRQTKAAEDSATAARLNAEAVINSERPWILMDWERNGPKIGPPYLVPIEDRADALAPHCLFSMKNFGKTPAKVLSGKATLKIGESPTEPPEIDIDNLDSRTETMFMFPQGDTRVGEARLPAMFINKNDRDAIDKGIKYLWLCGIIRYVDTFVRKDKTEPYVTTLCYLWETRTSAAHPFWQLAGPLAYNRAT
jgi:hypothetical protein